jgi:tetratricopeptide (TPR) repeat protein
MKVLRRVILLVAMGAMALPAMAAPSTAPTTAPSTQPVSGLSRSEQLFTDGRDALYRRDYSKAIELLTAAAAEDKTKTSYRLYLARALHYASQDKQAEPLLMEILKATPDHIEAGQLLGEIYAAQENWKGIVAVLEPLLKYRHDYQTYHLLADAKYNLNDNENARKYFEEAIKLNPQSALDHYQLGNIYLGGNFFALAADAYQNALRLGLKSPILHYKLGSAYFNLRNYFGSIGTVTVKAGAPGTISGDWYLIEQVPGHKDLFRAAPSASAIYQIGKAIADGIEDRPDIKFLRANIYLNAGRYDQAYAMYRQIRGVIPKEDQALFLYYFSQAAFGVGRYEEYLSLLNDAIKLNKAAYQPTLVEAYLKVADQYNQAGDLPKYIDYLTKAVNESPQTASLHLKLGNAYEEVNRHADAAVEWQMVLDLEPDHPKRLELLNMIVRSKSSATTRPSGK